MSRATYNQLTSPIAQLEAARDFVGQMEAVVSDQWRDNEDPEDQAKHEGALNFLERLEEEGFHAQVLKALRKLGLRFEEDGEDENDDGYFACECQNWPHDLVLHRLAEAFHKEVTGFAPDGWELENTFSCLGWEKLVLVPDTDTSVKLALEWL